MEITIKIDEENVEVTKIKKDTNDVDGSRMSPKRYARFFDEGSQYWTPYSEFNLLFLKTVQSYANDRLKYRGYLFLNEVYDMLGIPRTKAGYLVGWIYDEEHPYRDNFVDFDIFNERNSEAINGYGNKFLLDFNVDGEILNALK